jgi:molybdopterin/thiamine biosynthesis adenylyltransferase
MSHKLINNSPDLKKLRDEGYSIEIRSSYLLIHDIPYVTSQKEIAIGILVSLLEFEGERTAKPQDHKMYFIGEHPCDIEGNILTGIRHESNKTLLIEGLEIDHSFSNKPTNNYVDYFEKVTNYINLISSQAEYLDKSISVKTFRVFQFNEPDSPFNYPDSNSSRAEILAISEKLKKTKIAIVGLGGTGSYILDFVAKTPVEEIHIFDEDTFHSHNAFRAPGAASVEEVNNSVKKVTYLYNIYSKMHKYITKHEYQLSSLNLEKLLEMDFVFICIDNSKNKKTIIEFLINKGIQFIDTGIGIQSVDGHLIGSTRVTTFTPEKNDHFTSRITETDGDIDEYNQNIQIAEINALTASLAVIKWKKLFGIYHDFVNEYHLDYDISSNLTLKDEIIT